MNAAPGTLEAVEEHFVTAVNRLVPGFDPPGEVGFDEAFTVFAAQAASRHTDLLARRLRSAGRGFYTIGSAGHEANAWVAATLRPSDPALLHYRSGGFYCLRARQVSTVDPVEDMLLGVLASTREPIAGGRHKVFGRRELAVLPQTSTIASHLPRAFGLARWIGRHGDEYPADSIVVCSFGDASVNHSTAAGTLNAIGHAAYQGTDVPLLLVCEDNGIGISVPTPAGWTARTLSSRPGIDYIYADGSDPVDGATKARQAADIARDQRRPVILHLRTVRYGGHAGTDVETAYRDPQVIRDDYAADPLLGTARLLVERFGVAPEEVLDEYRHAGDEVARTLKRIGDTEQHRDAGEVMRVIAPRTPALVAREAARFAPEDPQADTTPLTLAQAINRTLDQAIGAGDDVLVFGEDVGAKGGVYGVTRGLQKAHTEQRVFDTLLDEQTILGLALGAANAGFLPVPEIQYLAYLHNAEDQLRGEAATLQYFSQGAYRNGMVVRVAGYGYQKGFGGHFHNDNAVAVLRDIPGLVVASPSRPDDAAAMLRTCLAAGRVDGTVSVFLEPIALYHTADLYESGDRAWLQPLPAEDHVQIGSARIHPGQHDGREDLLIVTYANGVPMSLRAARRLRDQGIDATVLDLRWLAPLPIADIVAHSRSGRILIVDETRTSGGVSEGIISRLVDAGYRGVIGRVAAKDSFIPLGDAALTVLVSEDEIISAAQSIAAS